MKPNKYQRRTDLYNRLAKLGFTMEEADKLRRIEKTLHRWAEHECNGNIQRDEDTGNPIWYCYTESDKKTTYAQPVADRERGALKRLEAIIAKVNKELAGAEHLWFYHRTDPRGCSLFVGRKSDLRPGQDLSGCYSSVGVAVCD